MNIYYISLGSFCDPKIIIRETNRQYAESLPFDFNSTPHLSSITKILKELHKTNTYDIELKEILTKYNGDELSVSEKNDIYLVHFFKEKDLKYPITQFPTNADILSDDSINIVKQKFKKRFERLANILNDTNNIICFIRVEDYANINWHYELIELTEVLALFKNPNKYLIYTQTLIDENLHFSNSNILNYNYHIPIYFFKHNFCDVEIRYNKKVFTDILISFEKILKSENILNIKYNNVIEQYYINKEKLEIYKLSNIKYYSSYYLDNNILYINNVITGYNKYIKNEDNIFEFV